MEQPNSPNGRVARSGAAAYAPLLIGVGAVAGILGLAWLLADHPDGPPIEYIQCEPTGRPRVVEAASSRLPDDTPVIGVAVGNRYRAYAFRAFDEIEAHVVNDFLNGAPVTVAYCPTTGCTRVYTASDRSQPLDVAVGGWSNPAGAQAPGSDSVMVLRVGSDHYLQDTGVAVEGGRKFPYREIQFEKTTWGKWKLAHPETDVVPGSNTSP